MRYLRLMISVFLLALISAPALGIVNYDSYWYWMWGVEEQLPNSPQLGYEYLTYNNGAHAVSMTKWASPESAWVAIVAENDSPNAGLRAFAHQYGDFLNFRDTTTIACDADYFNVCVAAAGGPWNGRKVVTFCEDDDDCEVPVHACADDLWVTDSPWPNPEVLSASGKENDDGTSAVVMEDRDYGCAVFPAAYDDLPDRLQGMMGARTTNGGEDWSAPYWVVDTVRNGPGLTRPSICKGIGGDLHLAYAAIVGEGEADMIKYCQGSDHGASGYWSTPVGLDSYDGAGQPCIACLGDTVVVCWTRTWGSESRIYYTWSTDGGDNWPNGVNEVPLDYSGPTKYSHPNISMVLTFGRPTVVMVCAVHKAVPPRSSVAAAYGKYWSNHNPPTMFWSRCAWLTTGTAGNDIRYCPSVATLEPWRNYTVPQGIAVWSAPYTGGNRDTSHIS